MKNVLWFILCCLLVVTGCNDAEKPKHQKERKSKGALDLLKHGEFVGYVDSLGSFISSQPIQRYNMITVGYMITRVTDTINWPWVDIECFIDEGLPWQNLAAVEVEYKSSDPLSVVLAQPVLLDLGESYRFVLPTTQTWKTIHIPIDSFKQPFWSAHRDIALNLQELRSIGLQPEINTEDGAKAGRFEIKKFIVHGLSWKDLNEKKTPKIVFYHLKEGSVYVSVQKAGTYSIDLFNTQNQLVHRVSNIKLQKDYNAIPLGRTLKSGSYKICIHGPDCSLTKTALVGHVMHSSEIKTN